MNTNKNEAEKLPEDVELLLPWHAAGTLSRRDAARVEQALANDNELATRYELVREELGEAIRLNEKLGAPSSRAMEQLFAKIDAEPARKPAVSFNLGAWLTDFVSSFQPRTLAYGATAAALAIVLQAGILAGVFVKESGPGFTAASLTVERRQRLRRGALQARGELRRHHQVPDRQQGDHRRRPAVRRPVQAAAVRALAAGGRAQRDREENLGEPGGGLRGQIELKMPHAEPATIGSR